MSISSVSGTAGGSTAAAAATATAATTAGTKPTHTTISGADLANARALKKQGWSYAQIAKRYGVTNAVAQRVLNQA